MTLKVTFVFNLAVYLFLGTTYCAATDLASKINADKSVSPQGDQLILTANSQSTPGSATESQNIKASHHGETVVLKLVHEKSGLDSMEAVAWSPNGKLLALAGDNLNVILWDSQSLSPVLTLNQSSKGIGYHNVAFSPDGRYVASGLSTVDIWEATGKLHAHLIAPHITPGIPQFAGIESLVFSPSGKTLAVAFQGAKFVVIAFRVDDGKLLWSYEPQKVLGRPLIEAPMVFSHDGASLLVATGERGGDEVNMKPLSRILFLDAESGALQRSFDDVHMDKPQALAISSDGQRIATGIATGDTMAQLNNLTRQTINWENTDPIRIWDFNTGALIRELPVQTHVRALAFSRNGKFVIACKDDIHTQRTLVVWEIKSGSVVQEIRHPGTPMSLAVSPDGKRIAAASGDALSVYEFNDIAIK